MIRCENVVCGYGRTPSDNPVLKGINLEIEEGKSYCILGANGCGKTTLLRAISGMLPYQGSITLGDKQVSKLKRKEIASCIAMLSQISQIYFSYTVEEAVMLGRYLYADNFLGIPSKRDREIVSECIEKNGLKELKDRQISSLSGGQMQRMLLARTMAQMTPIIVLDEPTNHLDLKYRAELESFLKEWKKDSGHTLIAVFHDINSAIEIGDEFIFMKEGQIVSERAKENFLDGDELQEIYGMDVKLYMKKQLLFWK
ncbi:MAG: ABC transporter ATP-binding protein [Butyrivibrio sp.]|nr:ABC transporter ATP-binding protein [Butyrivibrio sp.]